MLFLTRSGMTWEEAGRRCPKGIVPACHNSRDTVTISGPASDVATFVAELQKEGVFAREVDSAGNAFHSYFMDQAAPNLRKHLAKVLYCTCQTKRLRAFHAGVLLQV